MIYKFSAYGHPNILGTHRTTLEFTKDKELSLKGDCIIGVEADFELKKIKEFIEKSKNNKITITLKPKSNIKKYQEITEMIKAEFNQNFSSNKEFVIRKTNFASERTFAIKANKAAFELDKNLIIFLKKKKNKMSVVIENKE